MVDSSRVRVLVDVPESEARAARVRELQLSNRHLGGFGMPVGAALSTDAVGRVLGYTPSWIDMSFLVGSFGWFFMWFLLFIKQLPVIAIAEVKGVIGTPAGAGS